MKTSDSTLRLFLGLSLFMSSFIGGHSFAQSQATIASPAINTCKAGFAMVEEFTLCATRGFDKPAFQAFKPRRVCGDGYVKLTGLPFCVINQRSARVSINKGNFIVSRAQNGRCGAGYQRAEGTNLCVDQQLALSRRGTKIRFEMMPSLQCNDNECRNTCAPGYLKPLGMDTCVAWDLAKTGHPKLTNPDTNCSNSLYWKKQSNRGLCLPTLKVRHLEGRRIGFGASNRSCGSGLVPQVINASIPTTQSASQSAVDSFDWAPIVFCSPPGRIKF